MFKQLSIVPASKDLLNPFFPGCMIEMAMQASAMLAAGDISAFSI